MKNIIIITEDGEQLISSTDDGTNQLIINDTVIPSADWVGTGTYTATIQGHAITITKAPVSTGNIQLVKLADYSYSLKIIKDISSLIINTIYPVGSYYETSDSTFDPNVEWGGTWELEIEGQVHVSAGNNYTVSGALSNTSDGGSKDAIIPYHRHSVSAVSGAITGGSHFHTTYREKVAANGTGRLIPGASATAEGVNTNSKTHTHDLPSHNTNYVGTDGNTNNANMQPYIVVYRWHRTA